MLRDALMSASEKASTVLSNTMTSTVAPTPTPVEAASAPAKPKTMVSSDAFISMSASVSSDEDGWPSSLSSDDAAVILTPLVTLARARLFMTRVATDPPTVTLESPAAADTAARTTVWLLLAPMKTPLRFWLRLRGVETPDPPVAAMALITVLPMMSAATVLSSTVTPTVPPTPTLPPEIETPPPNM